MGVGCIFSQFAVIQNSTVNMSVSGHIVMAPKGGTPVTIWQHIFFNQVTVPVK